MFSAVTGLAARQWRLFVCRMGVGAGEAAFMPVSTRVVRGRLLRPRSAARRPDGTLAVCAGPRCRAAHYGRTDQHKQLAARFLDYGHGESGLGGALRLLPTGEARETPANGNSLAAWGRLLRHRSILGLVVCKFFQDYTFYLFVTWLPAYLIRRRGFTLMKGSWYAVLPWIAGFLFSPLRAERAIGWFAAAQARLLPVKAVL